MTNWLVEEQQKLELAASIATCQSTDDDSFESNKDLDPVATLTRDIMELETELLKFKEACTSTDSKNKIDQDAP